MSRGLRYNRSGSLVLSLDLQLERELKVSRRTNMQIDLKLEELGDLFENPFHTENQPPNNPPTITQNNQQPPNQPPNYNMGEPTLKELIAPNLAQQPLCITYNALGNGDVALKSGFIHHLTYCV